jgi:hypothetical protein
LNSNPRKHRILALLTILVLLLGNISFGAKIKPNLQNHWASAAIQEGVQNAWIELDPEANQNLDDPITRNEFTELFIRVFEAEGKVSPNLLEPEVVEHLNALALNSGIYMTRLEAAYKLHVVLKLERKAETQKVYMDSQDIPNWAHESIQTMTQHGILSGYPDGTFRGQKVLTQAEAILLMTKAVKLWVNTVEKPLTFVESMNLEKPSKGGSTDPVVGVTDPAPPILDPDPVTDPVPSTDPDPAPEPDPGIDPADPGDPEDPDDTEDSVDPTGPEDLDDPVDPEEPVVIPPTGYTGELMVIVPDGGYFYAGIPIQVYVSDQDLNLDPEKKDTVTVKVATLEDYGIDITLEESGENSGYFIGSFTTDPEAAPEGIAASPYCTTTVIIDYWDALDANGDTNQLRSILFDIQPVSTEGGW